MKILYLATMETLLDNGILASQVLDLLARVSSRHQVLLVSVETLFRVGRMGVHINPLLRRTCRRSFLRELRARGIPTILIPFPFPQLKRWGICLRRWQFALLFIATYFPLCFLVHIFRPDIIHCRSYLSALLVSFLPGRKRFRTIFDPRGFLPEEGVEKKAWSLESKSYQLWKRWERRIIAKHDLTIALSERFAAHLSNLAPNALVRTILVGVDLERYLIPPQKVAYIRDSLAPPDSTIFTYVGSLGAWNDPEILSDLFRSLHERITGAFLQVLTTYPVTKLEDCLVRRGIPQKAFSVSYRHPAEIPLLLASSDYGLVPGRRFSPRDVALSLTNSTMIGLKVSEYLAAGLPLIVNRDITVVSSLVTRHGLGALFDPGNFELTANSEVLSPEIRPIFSARCRAFSEDRLSLDSMARGYLAAYAELSFSK